MEEKEGGGAPACKGSGKKKAALPAVCGSPASQQPNAGPLGVFVSKRPCPFKPCIPLVRHCVNCAASVERAGRLPPGRQRGEQEGAWLLCTCIM